LAALLLPLDIAVRRLVVTRHDLRRAWQKANAWLADRRPQLTAQPAARTEQLSSLLRAKGRAQESQIPAENGQVPGSTQVSPPAPARPKVQPPETGGTPAPSVTPSGPAPTSTSAALLAAKKRVREKKD
jgi:hypothetical protein